MAKNLLLALDQGTTSSRAILFDRTGRQVAVAQQELPQHYPQPGHVEHDAHDIWRTQLDSARAVAGQVDPAEIAAIGITNQRETTLLWDRTTGQPLHRAIVWQDRRTADYCSGLKRDAGIANLIQQKTGLIADAYFSASKIKWLLDHIPDARQRAAKGELAFGTVDSWLLWNLTGGTAAQGAVHATDVSNASRTMLFNIHTCQWDEELLALFDVPGELLPEVRDSAGQFGETGLFGRPIPITGIAGDQQAALFGQHCLSPGQAKNTYGTGCFLLANLGGVPAMSKHQLLTTVAWRLGGAGKESQISNLKSQISNLKFQISKFKFQNSESSKPQNSESLEFQNSESRSPEMGTQSEENQKSEIKSPVTYALEGSVFVGGAVVQWLRDGLGIIRSAGDIEALAQTVPDSGGVYLVPAFAGLGAPHWDQYARGTIAGITRGTTAAHFARAALDSIAFQVADLVDVFNADAQTPISELRVDGGAAKNDLLLQFQADLLQLPVLRPVITETTALGAALLAGLGAGSWKSADDLESAWKLDRRFDPRMGADQVRHRRSRWSAALSRALDWESPST